MQLTVSEQCYVGVHLKILAEKLQIICNFNQIYITVVLHIQSTGTCITVISNTSTGTCITVVSNTDSCNTWDAEIVSTKFLYYENMNLK